MKIVKKLYKLMLIASVFVAGFSSCQSGLEYEEAPESVYTEVGVSQFNVKARELFIDKIWAVNYGTWSDNYISTVTIGSSSSSNKVSWTNNTGKDYTLVDGTIVKPGEKVELTGSITTEDNSDAPEGKLYVMHSYILPTVIHETANKGFLFDKSKFSGDFELIEPDKDGRARKVELPIRANELIVEFYLVDAAACTVHPLDNAPELGKPGDFTSPRRYMVRNNKTYRPSGVEESKRMYEVRVTVLP